MVKSRGTTAKIFMIFSPQRSSGRDKNIYQPLSDPCFRCPQIYKRGMFSNRCERGIWIYPPFIRQRSSKTISERKRRAVTNIDEDAYDLIAAMTDTKQLQMVKDKYRSEEGGINMCKGLLDWVEESKIEGKSAGELTILKLITAMQLDGRTSDITRLSSEPEFLEGMKKHYHIQ